MEISDSRLESSLPNTLPYWSVTQIDVGLVARERCFGGSARCDAASGRGRHRRGRVRAGQRVIATVVIIAQGGCLAPIGGLHVLADQQLDFRRWGRWLALASAVSSWPAAALPTALASSVACVGPVLESNAASAATAGCTPPMSCSLPPLPSPQGWWLATVAAVVGCASSMSCRPPLSPPSLDVLATAGSAVAALSTYVVLLDEQATAPWILNRRARSHALNLRPVCLLRTKI